MTDKWLTGEALSPLMLPCQPFHLLPRKEEAIRAEFNNEMNVYDNDGNGGPAGFRFTTDCRRVYYDRNQIESPALSAVEAYVNYVGGILSAGSTSFGGGVIQIDTTDAYVIEFADDPGIFWFVRWCERWTPLEGPGYRRAHLQRS